MKNEVPYDSINYLEIRQHQEWIKSLLLITLSPFIVATNIENIFNKFVWDIRFANIDDNDYKNQQFILQKLIEKVDSNLLNNHYKYILDYYETLKNYTNEIISQQVLYESFAYSLVNNPKFISKLTKFKNQVVLESVSKSNFYSSPIREVPSYILKDLIGKIDIIIAFKANQDGEKTPNLLLINQLIESVYSLFLEKKLFQDYDSGLDINEFLKLWELNCDQIFINNLVAKYKLLVIPFSEPQIKKNGFDLIQDIFKIKYNIDKTFPYFVRLKTAATNLTKAHNLSSRSDIYDQFFYTVPINFALTYFKSISISRIDGVLHFFQKDK